MLETKFHSSTLGITAPIDTSDTVEISGYASVFGRIDQGGDCVQPGAYHKSLAALTQRGGKVRMLWQHDPQTPIGIWDEVREDHQGLWVKGRLLQNVTQGREAYALLQAGAIDGLSIGYRTVKCNRAQNGERQLQELDLWEVSLVTFPMQIEAKVEAKSNELDRFFFAMTEVIRDAKLNWPKV